MENTVHFTDQTLTAFRETQALICKLAALAFVAASIDTNSLDEETLNHYLWEMSDLAHEIKRLFQEAMMRMGLDNAA